MTTASAIYDQHDKHFSHVSAYVIVKDGRRVATVALRYPRDGASRLHAYVHWLGAPMSHGWAGGYGYDKGSAAVADAVRRLPAVTEGVDSHRVAELASDDARAFLTACAADAGDHWYDAVRKAGFDVWQAV